MATATSSLLSHGPSSIGSRSWPYSPSSRSRSRAAARKTVGPLAEKSLRSGSRVSFPHLFSSWSSRLPAAVGITSIPTFATNSSAPSSVAASRPTTSAITKNTNSSHSPKSSPSIPKSTSIPSAALSRALAHTFCKINSTSPSIRSTSPTRSRASRPSISIAPSTKFLPARATSTPSTRSISRSSPAKSCT